MPMIKKKKGKNKMIVTSVGQPKENRTKEPNTIDQAMVRSTSTKLE